MAVANGSRAMIADALERYPRTQIVLVDAPPAVRAERLASRGREDLEAVRRRLAREAQLPPAIPVTRIDNSGAVETALAALMAALRNGV